MSTRPVSQDWQFLGTPQAYEAYLAPMLSLWTPALLDRVALDADARLLDVACGTGTVARAAAQRLGASAQIVGLDLEPGMLAVARELAAEQRPAIDWREGDALALPFEDRSFDAVLCQQGLQFVPDAHDALCEMHRVLAPGGWLGLAVFRPIEFSPGYARLAETLERHAGAQAAALMRAPFALGDVEALRRRLTDAVFHDISIRIEIRSVRFPGAAEMLRREFESWLGGSIGELDDARRSTLVEDLARRLAPHTDDEGVVFPMEACCVTARRQD